MLFREWSQNEVTEGKTGKTLCSFNKTGKVLLQWSGYTCHMRF